MSSRSRAPLALSAREVHGRYDARLQHVAVGLVILWDEVIRADLAVEAHPVLGQANGPGIVINNVHAENIIRLGTAFLSGKLKFF